MLKEFREFAFKGNLIDMAVGIVIGGAFGTVVKSLVSDIVMPVIGVITGGINFSDRFAVLKKPESAAEDAVYSTAEAAREAGATVMTWGNFIDAFISFLIVALVLFIVIKKVIAAMQEQFSNPDEEEEDQEPEPSEEVKLLSEIRDLMKAEKT